MHLANAARRYRPDVIHSFSRVAYLLPLAFSRTPKIMSFQRYPGARSVGLGQKLCGRSLSFTGCSEYIAALGRKGGGNFISIHNGVELDRYTFRPTVANDAPLVYLSRLDKVKGAGLAIKVARRAGVPLVLAGNVASSGPDLDYFKREVEPHFGNGVEYVGPVNDQQKNDLLGRARAMLVPIQWDEPFGIVFVEALACGTPVISSPNGALPEIITEGRDGYLTRDEDALVEAIGKVHLLDRAACRRKVEEHFTAEIITTKYEQLYQAQLALR
jgi:glycosyltransferase involved in cell wall biosynthesis